MTHAKLVKLKQGVGLIPRADFESRIGGARQVVMVASPGAIGAINRLEGFDAGDRALARFTAALIRAAPGGAVVSRIGGAKFAVAAPAATDLDALDAMGGLFDHLCALTPDLAPPHVGGAWSEARVGAEAALTAALSALDAARSTGPHGVELNLIDPDEAMSDIALAREAIAAVRAGEIGAAFQPVVDAATPGGCCSARRWSGCTDPRARS